MITSEFYNEFNILYNNISSNSAPGLDKYEISVYLTKAQYEIVKEYNGVVNKYQKGFDASDKRRADLKELIVDYKTTEGYDLEARITDNLHSKFFGLPNDVFLIKYESVKYVQNNCSYEIPVKPISLDFFNSDVKNPFKKPNKDIAWRVDISSSSGNYQVEIITDKPVETYHLRYLKYPTPIILTDLSTDPEFEGMNLSIDGRQVEDSCRLNDEIHREILDRAVELAHRDYKENTLQNKVQLNNRNN